MSDRNHRRRQRTSNPNELLWREFIENALEENIVLVRLIKRNHSMIKYWEVKVAENLQNRDNDGTNECHDEEV